MKVLWIKLKQLTARLLSELLYAAGHLISIPMSRFDWAWLYPVYSRLMIASCNVQDWAGNDQPWSNIKDEE
jgi:hypothetical protein